MIQFYFFFLDGLKPPTSCPICGVLLLVNVVLSLNGVGRCFCLVGTRCFWHLLLQFIYVGENWDTLLGSSTCSCSCRFLQYFFYQQKNPKNCQYLHGHGIYVLQLYIANPCIYWVCSHHEPNVGKFAVPFTIITWDPMGKRFWVIHRYVSTQFVGVHQFWYFSHVNSSQISSTFEEFECTRLWNMINVQPDRRAQDFSRSLLGGWIFVVQPLSNRWFLVNQQPKPTELWLERSLTTMLKERHGRETMGSYLF